MDHDNITPSMRLAPLRQRRFPVVPALIGLVLVAYLVAQAVTDWGTSQVSFRIERSCGL